MSSIKIRLKFFILGMLAFLSLLFLGLLAFNINNQGFVNLSQVFTDFKKVQKLQSDYIEPLFTLRERNLTLVMSPNEDFKKEADKRLIEELEKLDKTFNDAPKEIYKKWENYRVLLFTTRVYSLEGFDEGSFMNATSSEREQFYDLISDLKQLQTQKLEDSENTFIEAKDNTLKSKYYIILGFLFVGITTFLFDMTVIRKIVDSIEKVQTGLFGFFTYLSNPKKEETEAYIKLDSKDELGLMAKGINSQVKLIKSALKNDYKLIEEATNTLHELKEGRFGKRLTSDASSEELNTLKNVMNEMIDNLENKIQEEITNRSNQEKLLVQQSKLAAMGNMLGNIAHQWRQPISEINAILMEVEAIARFDTLKTDFLLKSISSCSDVTEHMSSTISDFQNFFQPSKEKEYFNVHEVCLSAISIINASLKFHNIELKFNINENCEVYGYPREFAHAILNILSNSKDVLVERKIENPKIILSIKTGKQFTIIRIEDNAGGIKEENIDKIFEPYFTTKHATQGTGIGLYMTKMIIENNMNGFVNVENSQEGALFTIKLQK
ncbi:sensor histidine kinase [Arcobacter sp. LA11]|uniref:sensor histidine kinase n=1 Tax=Arcobacter sp. LA11 TaxID=1898176 RepID=UPI000935570A|nr:ATP-binding protein [Arcobacter sp. LA11]